MGFIRIFEILLADGKTVYFPGDVVRGTCVVDISKEIKLKFLRLTCHGGARIHFEGTDSDGNQICETSTFDYFTYPQTLFGNGESHL